MWLLSLKAEAQTQPHTRVFREGAQTFFCPWALILGGHLYDANILVENYQYLTKILK